MDRISSEIREQFKDTSSYLNAKLLSENEAVSSDFSSLLGKAKTIGLLIVALLLITSLNLGTMLLFNIYRRRQDFAIRRAIGASTVHLIKQIVGEVSILLVFGAVASLLLCWVLLQLFEQIPLDLDVVPELNSSTLTNGFVFLAFMGIIGASIPSLQIAFGSLKKTLNEGPKTSNRSRFAKYY